MHVIHVELSLLNYILVVLTWAFLSIVSSWGHADLYLMLLCTEVLPPF